MKIGRNDPCPCGSGKKYKNCCLRKETMSIPDRIKQAVKESGYNEDIGNVLANMYRYRKKKVPEHLPGKLCTLRPWLKPWSQSTH